MIGDGEDLEYAEVGFSSEALSKSSRLHPSCLAHPLLGRACRSDGGPHGVRHESKLCIHAVHVSS